jgi:hypothetical protein
MRYSVTWGLALASALALEGTCYARTTASSVHERLDQSQSRDDSGSPVETVVDAAPARPALFSDRDRADGAVSFTRIALCHISHHPRDGLPPDLHACPLFIAIARPPAAPPLPGAFVSSPRSTSKVERLPTRT